jgi:uncharacterized protein YcbK (DUF882 family)
MMRQVQLSPHFKLSEFLRAQDPFPSAAVIANLKRLAQALEKARKQLGDRPILITSGYRTPVHNAEVRGAVGSYHTRGMAADILVKGLHPRQVQAILKDWPGGLGAYATHTHVDIRTYKARWEI